MLITILKLYLLRQKKKVPKKEFFVGFHFDGRECKLPQPNPTLDHSIALKENLPPPPQENYEMAPLAITCFNLER